MITLVLKGEIKMYNFNYIDYGKCYTADMITKECSYIKGSVIKSDEVINYYKKLYLDKVYDIFRNKIDQVSNYLYEKEICTSNWNPNLIFETGTKIYKEIEYNYVKNSDLNENNLNDDIFKDFLDKVEDNFREIEEDSDSELDKYSQYYDFLNDMFISIQEVLDYETEKLKSINSYDSIQEDIKFYNLRYENNKNERYENRSEKNTYEYLIAV